MHAKAWRNVSLAAAGLAVVIVVGIVLLRYLAERAFPRPITDIAEYEATLAMWPDPDFTGHFPRTLPAEATDAKMFFSPGPLQAQTEFQLSLTLPPDAVAALITSSRERAIQEISGEAAATQAGRVNGTYVPKRIDHAQIDESGWPTDRPPFGPSYRIFIFHQYGGRDHVGVAGIAIDEHENHVVYFAEQD